MEPIPVLGAKTGHQNHRIRRKANDPSAGEIKAGKGNKTFAWCKRNENPQVFWALWKNKYMGIRLSAGWIKKAETLRNRALRNMMRRGVHTRHNREGGLRPDWVTGEVVFQGAEKALALGLPPSRKWPVWLNLVPANGLGGRIRRTSKSRRETLGNDAKANNPGAKKRWGLWTVIFFEDDGIFANYWYVWGTEIKLGPRAFAGSTKGKKNWQ